MTQIEEPTIEATLDTGPLGCGDLILMIFKTMRSIPPGGVLLVMAYDDGAAMDIPAWCRSTGNALLRADSTGRPARFHIQRRNT